MNHEKLVYKHLILDWDGTLCNSIPRQFEVTCSIFADHKLPHPTFTEYVEEMAPPFIDFYHRRGVALVEDAFWAHYNGATQPHTSVLFQNTRVILDILRGRKHSIAVVSGQRREIIEQIAAKHSCRHFINHVVADVTPTKVPAFLEVCKLMNAEPHTVAAVGDFASDMRHAAEAGLIPVGIVHDYKNGMTESVSEILRKAGARHIIKSLRELL